jgi:hypothetical protein
MEHRWRFRLPEVRGDTAEIKHKCFADSVDQKQYGDSWNTLYLDSYIRWPLGRRTALDRPPPGIHIGGGNLAGDRDDVTKSDYTRHFPNRWDPNAVPPKAPPLGPSDIFPHDYDERLATISQLAMEEAVANRPAYDNRDAKERVADARRAHFFMGEDTPVFETNYTRYFGPKKTVRPPPADLGLQKSSIEFDADAGLGPNTMRLREKRTFPQIADAPVPNHLKANFDLGHDRLNYRTTTADGLRDGRYGAKRVNPARAPACAELATHGDAAGKWETHYHSDFQKRPAIANPIDVNDLRGTHFDIGHAPTDYSPKPVAVSTGMPPRETMDLQTSNPVFRGDQQMRWRTTSADLIGVYDKSKDGRGTPITNRRDDVFIGGDKPEFTTTAADANRLAGTGKPAAMCQDLHLLKGPGFGRGGTWDTFAETPGGPDEKVPMGYPKTEKIDGTYFKESHFDLEATEAHKGLWETTYFEEICRPKILEDAEVPLQR